uniref:Uncharacterized protein n=1 Tax=Caenorhabditis japonica TaxID=281687 RepID=A0A8R1E3P7_CAEJA
MSLNKEPPSSVALLQVVIFLQFSASFFIVVLTTVGLSYDYPVASYYLLALLQVIVALPGVVHILIQGITFAAIYIAFQLVTAACEIYWLVYMISTNATFGRWIGLALLTFINVSAVVIGLWFRSVMVKMPGKQANEENNKGFVMREANPEMKAPPTSIKSISNDRSKKRSRKTSSTSSPSQRKKTVTSSTRSKSSASKKSSSSRATRRSPNLPRDSRETSNFPPMFEKSVNKSDTEK